MCVASPCPRSRGGYYDSSEFGVAVAPVKSKLCVSDERAPVLCHVAKPSRWRGLALTDHNLELCC